MSAGYAFSKYRSSSKRENILYSTGTVVVLTRGLASISSRCNQESLVVKDKDERPKQDLLWCTAFVYAEVMHCREVSLG